MGSADFGAAGERITYGNQAGRSLLEDRHEMKEMMKRLEDRMAQFADHQDQTARPQHRADIPTEGYHGTRHRSTDVHRRDALRNVTEQGSIRINKGNIAAHKGDAVTDAMLYTTNQRDDEDVLISLYGLTADQISFLFHARDYSSITTLNAGATWRAKGATNIPADVTAAYTNRNRNLSDGTTALSRAYSAFWTAHNNHK